MVDTTPTPEEAREAEMVEAAAKMLWKGLNGLGHRWDQLPEVVREDLRKLAAEALAAAGLPELREERDLKAKLFDGMAQTVLERWWQDITSERNTGEPGGLPGVMIGVFEERDDLRVKLEGMEELRRRVAELEAERDRLAEVVDALVDERRARIMLGAARKRQPNDDGHGEVADAGTAYSRACDRSLKALHDLKALDPASTPVAGEQPTLHAPSYLAGWNDAKAGRQYGEGRIAGPVEAEQ